MAKIGTYQIDNVVNGDDLLLGTDTNSTPPNLTKNFTVDKVVDYMRGYQEIEVIINDPLAIRALPTTPITIVPAQGGNKVISPLFMSITMGAGDTYNFAVSLLAAGLWDGAAWNPQWLNASSPLNNVTQSTYAYYTTGCASAVPYTAGVNGNFPFVIGNSSGADATQGTRPVRIIFQYQVLDFNI